MIAEHISRCPNGKVPWFILDELDKANGDRGFPVGPALLGLLEPYTAQNFRDEALQLDMDIRPACFIFTANERHWVRPELLSRIQVVEVRAPTSFEMPAVISSVDAQLRKDQPKLAQVFRPLDPQVLLHLDAVAPRELRRVLLTAYANAARRTATLPGRRLLMPQDLPEVSARQLAVERVVH